MAHYPGEQLAVLLNLYHELRAEYGAATDRYARICVLDTLFTSALFDEIITEAEFCELCKIFGVL